MKRYHTIMDLEEVTLPGTKKANKEYLLKYLNEIVSAIKMKIISGPHVVYGKASSDGGQCGYTVVCVVDFSSITIHHFEDDAELKVDIFSCKKFDYRIPVKITKEYFGKKMKFMKNIKV